jgi:hypothetical protein
VENKIKLGLHLCFGSLTGRDHPEILLLAGFEETVDTIGRIGYFATRVGISVP